MKNTVIVDTSIVVKWVHDEPDSDIAVALLKEWTSKGTVMLAPALLAYEITNVLYHNTRKGEIARDRAIETLEDIMLLGLEFDFPLDSALSVRATELAHQFGLQATYDAYYLALAEREGCELWTSDTKMWRAVGGKFPWVRRLKDYSTSLEDQDIAL